MLATISMALLLAQSATAGHHHSQGWGGAGVCSFCGGSPARVASLIGQLQTCRDEDDREDAAEDLRDVNWRCHPEAAEALASALLRDPDDDVREEAAESLAKMAPCLPNVHAALNYAATYERDGGARRWAYRGLTSVGGRCQAACQVCGPTHVGPAPILLEPAARVFADGVGYPPPTATSPYGPRLAPVRPLGQATGAIGGPNLAPILPGPTLTPPPVPVGPYGPAY